MSKFIYAQDKRSRMDGKHLRGTKKYPVFYIGIGDVVGKEIIIQQGFPLAEDTDVSKFRFCTCATDLEEVREDIVSIKYV